jgi:hypothetical protein
MDNGNPPVPSQSAAGVQPDGGVLGQMAMGALSAGAKAVNTLPAGATVDTQAMQEQPQQPQPSAQTATLPAGAKVDSAPATPSYSPLVLKYAKEQNVSPEDAIKMMKGVNPDVYDTSVSGNAAENLGSGFMKGGAKTVGGLTNLAEKIPGVTSAVNEVPALREMAAASRGENGDIETHGAMQGVGNVGEDIFEFVLGDEALKGVALADKFKLASKIADLADSSPQLAKVLGYGLNFMKGGGGQAIRQGAVSAAQTIAKGGTARQAGENAALTGGVSGLFSAISAGTDMMYKSILNNTPEEIAAKKLAARQSGEALADKIAGQSVASPYGVAKDTQKALAAAEDGMHADYTQGLHLIGEAAKDIPIAVKGSALETAAKDIITGGEETPEAWRDALKIAGTEQLEPLLGDLAKGKGDYSWAQMESIRSDVGKTIRKMAYDNPVRTDLINIRGAIDQTMEDAAADTGHASVASDMKALRETYATQTKAFEDHAVEMLSDKNPNTVADVLINKHNIDSVNALRSLIQPKNMQKVEGSLLRSLVDRASTTGEFDPAAFVKRFNGLGEDVQQAFWGDELPEVKNLLEQAKNVPTGGAIWSGLARYMEHRAIFDFALGGLTGVTLWGGGKLSGHELIAPAVIIGGLLMLHNASALKVATRMMKTAASAAAPVAAGTAATNPSTSMPEGYTHVRTSDGAEFYVPIAQVNKAQQLDPNLQIIQ